jgi:hypothetical protein
MFIMEEGNIRKFVGVLNFWRGWGVVGRYGDGRNMTIRH